MNIVIKSGIIVLIVTMTIVKEAKSQDVRGGIFVNTYLPIDNLELVVMTSYGKIFRTKDAEQFLNKTPTDIRDGFVYFDNFKPNQIRLQRGDANCILDSPSSDIYSASDLTVVRDCYLPLCRGYTRGGPPDFRVIRGSCSPLTTMPYTYSCIGGTQVQVGENSIVCNDVSCSTGVMELSTASMIVTTTGVGQEVISIGVDAQNDITYSEITRSYPNLTHPNDLYCPPLGTTMPGPEKVVAISIGSYTQVITAFPSDSVRYSVDFDDPLSGKRKKRDIAGLVALGWLSALEVRFNMLRGDVQANRDGINYNADQISMLWKELGEERRLNRVQGDQVKTELGISYQRGKTVAKAAKDIVDIKENMIFILEAMKRGKTMVKVDEEVAKMNAKSACQNETGRQCMLVSQEEYASGARSYMWGYGDACTIYGEEGCKHDATSCTCPGSYIYHNGEEGIPVMDPMIMREDCGFYLKNSTVARQAMNRKLTRSELLGICKVSGCMLGMGIVPCGIQNRTNSYLRAAREGQPLSDVRYFYNVEGYLCQECENNTQGFINTCGQCQREQDFAERALRIMRLPPMIQTADLDFVANALESVGKVVDGAVQLPLRAISKALEPLELGINKILLIVALVWNGVLTLICAFLFFIIRRQSRKADGGTI